MYRKRKKSKFDEYTITICSFFLAICIFTYLPRYFQSVGWFSLLVMYIGIVMVTIFGLYISISRWRKDKKLQGFLRQITENNLEEYIVNFINRFGYDHGKSNWNFREHAFSWDRLRDFRKILNEKGVSVSIDNFKDIDKILKYYIQRDEEKITRDSVQVKQNKFSFLSGKDFENLLVRLFTAMGYTVQHSGKVGDQGCDLILNSSDARYVVQAKRYSASIGNSAIQEAVAAQKLYDCNKAMVVTNSDFTAEAIALAKVNNVELVNHKQLSGLLLQYLKESWN